MLHLGSGCGAVGRVVATDARDPRFEFSLILLTTYQLY